MSEPPADPDPAHPHVNLWFDPEPGLPQFTILGITICWQSVVIARRWRIIHLGFKP